VSNGRKLPGDLLLGWDTRRSGQAGAPPTAPSAAIWHNGEGHLVTIAPTGAGKGVSCIIPALLTWDGSAIVVDPKGENYAVTAARRRALGQEVVVLDPFAITDADRLGALNPLDLLAESGEGAEDDAAVIARLLIQGRISAKEPYWDERAETLIAGLILYVAKRSPREARTLGEIRTLVEQSEPALDSTARDMHRAGHPDISAAANILQTRATNTRAGIMSSASSHLSFLRAGPVLGSLAESTVRLEDVRAGKPLTIYLVVPPDKLLSHGKLLRLWLGVLMTVLARRRRIPEKQTLLVLDEAAQLGPLDELRAALTLMRSYGVKVWSFWQDLSQLMRTYPLDWQSLMNNCSVQQFFGAATPQAAAEIEAYLGRGAQPAHARIEAPDALLIKRGEPPLIIRRASYLTDPLLAGLARANPFYPPLKGTGARRAGRMPDNVIEFPLDRLR
jgi:type IV secretion system protein VirD4